MRTNKALVRAIGGVVSVNAVLVPLLSQGVGGRGHAFTAPCSTTAGGCSGPPSALRPITPTLHLHTVFYHSNLTAAVQRDQPAMLQSLHVEVSEGKDLKDKDLFGKSDPYVVLQVGGEKHQTTVKKGTLNPVWHEKFTFSSGPMLSVEVWGEWPSCTSMGKGAGKQARATALGGTFGADQLGSPQVGPFSTSSPSCRGSSEETPLCAPPPTSQLSICRWCRGWSAPRQGEGMAAAANAVQAWSSQDRTAGGLHRGRGLSLRTEEYCVDP